MFGFDVVRHDGLDIHSLNLLLSETKLIVNLVTRANYLADTLFVRADSNVGLDSFVILRAKVYLA